MNNRANLRSGKRHPSLVGWHQVLLAAALAVALVWSTPVLRAAPPGARLAVATESQRASREAMAQLTAGGNAVDAAVTAALVGGVTNSSSSGIGGGAFIHYFDQASGQSLILDARETGPLGLVAEEFEARPFAAEARGKYVGVPGEVAGLYALHRRYGKRPWSKVVAPAISAAKLGFDLEEHTAKVVSYAESSIRQDPGLSGLWLKQGRLAKRGDRVRNPALARTLKRIAQEGPKAFYEGPVAAEMVNTVRGHGGALSLEDLLAYRVIERTPITIKWADYEVHTMPPPSAGGIMLAQALKVFTQSEYAQLGHNTSAYQHALAESFRASLADRARFIGDPDHQPVDVDALISDARMAKRRQKLSLGRTHAIPRFSQEEHGTHQLVTADAQGNVVSLTTTVNRGFGAKLMAKTSGVVLNDELNDYAEQEQALAFGLSQSPNRPRPGSRPVSSMTPTIVVKNGKAVLAAGGSGGMTIATNVAQTIISQLTFGIPPAELVASPRFQVPTEGAFIAVPESTPKTHVADLERRGEIVDFIRFTMSAVQMITIDESGQKRAGADPRKHGLALVK